jgi:hypothetical protein
MYRPHDAPFKSSCLVALSFSQTDFTTLLFMRRIRFIEIA